MAVDPIPSDKPWETAELFQTLIATVADGIAVIDPQDRVRVCNATCADLFGYAMDEMIGRDVRTLIPQFHRPHDDQAHRAGSAQEPFSRARQEMVGRRRDGAVFPMMLSLGTDRLGEQRFLVGIIHDLSDLKSQSMARLNSDRLLAQIVQSSDDAIISKSLDGVITSWNASAENIFGYSAAEAVGRNIAMLFPPELLPEEEQITAKLRAGQEIDHYETVRRRKDGRDITVMLSVAPVRDEAGRVVGASKIARDITERKQAEFQTQKLQSELAHVARLSAMGQMSAAIAHELNQPLTAITNYVKAAHRMLGAPDLSERQVASARDAMEKAAGQTLRAGTIIRSLREFVEKRDSDRTREDLNAMVKEAVTLGLVGSASSNIEVMLDLGPAIVPVTMNKIQIQQVLINLIRNSMEAMATASLRRLTIATAQDGPGQVSIVIRDTGPGLAVEVQQKLFQPFVTTKQQGMGIGLMICQSIVEAHGGTIRSIADSGGGAAFQIKLPAGASGAEPPSHASP